MGRARGFASLGILTLMLGLSDQLQLWLKVGGSMGIGICFVLVVRAMLANHLSYKRREVWIMLKQGERPSPATAQQLSSRTLRRVCVEVVQCTKLKLKLECALRHINDVWSKQDFEGTCRTVLLVMPNLRVEGSNPSGGACQFFNGSAGW